MENKRQEPLCIPFPCLVLTNRMHNSRIYLLVNNCEVGQLAVKKRKTLKSANNCTPLSDSLQGFYFHTEDDFEDWCIQVQSVSEKLLFWAKCSKKGGNWVSLADYMKISRHINLHKSIQKFYFPKNWELQGWDNLVFYTTVRIWQHKSPSHQ